MNTETGRIYRDITEVAEATLRGEPIVPVSNRVANMMEHGNRLERRRAKAKARSVAAKQKRSKGKK